MNNIEKANLIFGCIVGSELDYDTKHELVDFCNKQLDHFKWIPCSADLPEVDEDLKTSDYVLVSFENASMVDIARYEDAEFHPGDDDVPYIAHGIKVNAWMPLPKPYNVERLKSR